jgi:hypothetical protein
VAEEARPMAGRAKVIDPSRQHLVVVSVCMHA